MKMQQDYFGIGSIGKLGAILAQEKPQSIFLVHGKSSYSSCWAEEKLTPLLGHYRVTPFADFSSNAKAEDIEKGIALFQENSGDMVIAVGGGSALDVAKGIACLSADPGKVGQVLQKKIPLPPRRIPLIAIPTTAGTGSEATHFAAVYLGKDKYSLAHSSLVPDYAIVDPSLTFTLPAYQTACTGMDALSQAVESYWSIHSTAQSKQYAQEAIILALAHLEKAVCAPDAAARTGMAKAANLAGKAINISFTTACHAISYPITSYFKVPHGHAVGLTLPEMVRYNGETPEKECGDARGLEYVQATMDDLYSCFGVSSPQKMKEKIEELMDGIGLERRLSGLKIRSAEDIDLILQHGFNPERVKNNPRVLREDVLRAMLQHIA